MDTIRCESIGCFQNVSALAFMNCNQLFFCFLVTKIAIVARADTAAFRLSLLNLLYFPVSCEPSIPLDLVLVVDSSGSIRQQNDPSVLDNNDPNDNWQRMMTFLWDLTWQFDDASLQIGIVMFSSSAQIITQLTNPRAPGIRLTSCGKITTAD